MNEQVKAGLAALKDFLGGHNEPETEQREVTSERQASTSAENASSEPETVETGAKSSARANTNEALAGEIAHREANDGEPHANPEENQARHNDAPEDQEAINPGLNGTVEHAPAETAYANESGSGTSQQESTAQQSINQASFEDAVEALRAAGSSDERVAAARSIAELGSQRATPHLIAAMFDDDPKVRNAAEEALANIGEPRFEQHTTPKDKTENLTMMQSPSNVPERSDSSPITGSVDQPQAKASAEIDEPQQNDGGQNQVVQPAAKPHKLKAVPNKTEAANDPDASEEEQQLLLEERAVRQRLDLIVQQLSEKTAARRDSENEVHWRLERESKLLADAATQRANEEEARKKAEEEAVRRRKQEAEAIAAEQSARAKADAELELLANAEVRLRNEVAKLNQAADELAQRRRVAENSRLNAEAAARLAEAQRLRDEADRTHKAEVERLRTAQTMLNTATEKATARRAEVEAARERAEKEAAALAEAEARMAAAEDARLKAETERVKLETELNLKVQTEEALLAAAHKRAQEEQARLEEEARRHREAEERRMEELQESRRRAETEAKQRAEREQHIRHQLDTLRISDADVRKRIEEGEVRRRAAEAAFRLVAEKVQRVEAEAHAAKLEEEQILARLEAARRNAAVDAQARAEQEKRIKDEIEMFRRLEDEERPRLEELMLQRSDAETRLHDLRERFSAEEEAHARAEEQTESQHEYQRPVAQHHVTEAIEETVRRDEPLAAAPVSRPAPVQFAETVRASTPEAATIEAEIRGAAPELPPAISSYLHSVDPYKRAAAVAELARARTSDSFALIARCFDDHSPHVRNAAARALRKLEPHKSVDLFNRAMEEGSAERRKNIGSAIAASGLAGEAIENLVSENREDTYNSLSILFVMAKTGEVQPLVEAIEEHRNEEVCRAVLKLLTLSGQSDLGDAALQRRVMGVSASRQKPAERHDEIPDFRLRIAEVEVKRALNHENADKQKVDD